MITFEHDYNFTKKHFTVRFLTNWTNNLIYYTLLFSWLNAQGGYSSPISFENLLSNDLLELCVGGECVTDSLENVTTFETNTEMEKIVMKSTSNDEYSTEREEIPTEEAQSDNEASEKINEPSSVGETVVTWPAALNPFTEENDVDEKLSTRPKYVIYHSNEDDAEGSTDDIANENAQMNLSTTNLLNRSDSEYTDGVDVPDDEGKNAKEYNISVTSNVTTPISNFDDDQNSETENFNENTKSTFYGTFFDRSGSSSSNHSDENSTESKDFTKKKSKMERINHQDNIEAKPHKCKIMYPNGTIVIPDSAGHYGADGNEITVHNEVDKCGRPVTQSEGNLMFTDSSGNPVTDKHGNIIYVDGAGNPVTDCNGMAVYTDSSGNPIVDRNGNRIQTDRAGNPITDNKSGAVSTDSAGRPIYTDSEGKALTDVNGNILFTDKNGRIITDKDGRNVYTDECQRPIYTYSDGKPITNNKGEFLYTDCHGNPILTGTSPMSPHAKDEEYDYVDNEQINVDYEDLINQIPNDEIRNAEKMTKCNAKKINGSEVICLCNKTYCDKFMPIHRVPKGQYLWFSSSKSGLRFDKKTLEFAENRATYRNAFYVDFNQKMQKIIGFGGTFTDSASQSIKKLSSPSQNHLLESYFGYFGIRYSLGRVPIGSTEFSPNPYTYMDHVNQSMNEFMLTENDFKYKIPLILKALNMTDKKLKLIGTAWTAPKWMKTICSLTNGGALRREYWSLWAKYHLKFLDDYADKGVPFWALSTGSEPTNIDNFGMEWSPYQQQQWITYHLAPQLQNSHHNHVLILAFDDNREYLPFYMKWLFENFEGKKYKDLQCVKVNEAYENVSGIALHWYKDTRENLKYLNYIHELYPDKFLLYTEASCSPFNLGSWDCAEHYALDIISNLNNWVTGWMDFNLALNSQGGPNWRKNSASASVIVNEKRDEFYKQPSYYVMGHFSKFILPDSYRIKITPTMINNVTAVAVERPDKGFAIVFYNKNEREENITIVIDQHRAILLTVEGKSINSILFW